MKKRGNAMNTVQTTDGTIVEQGTKEISINSKIIRLLGSMLKIGVVGFGGGSALIPVIEQEVVHEQKIVSKMEYEEDVVAACVTPGALPVEIASGIGYRRFGIVGMLLSAIAMASPGALLTVLIVSALSETGEGTFTFVRMLSIGLGAFIATLLMEYALKTVKTAKLESKKYEIEVIGLIILVVLATGPFAFTGIPFLQIKLSTVQILAITFIGCFLASLKDEKSETVKRRISLKQYLELGRLTVSWIAFAGLLSIPAILLLPESIVYSLNGFLSSLLSFGGGDAYLSIADGMFVSSGMVDSTAFYGTLVPVANVLPGSILCKILAGTGYLVGLEKGGSVAIGLVVAISGFAISVAASGMIFSIVCWIFRTFKGVCVFCRISRWIRPVISGLLLNVAVVMVRTNQTNGDAIQTPFPFVLILTGALIIFNLYLLKKKKMGNFPAMAVSGTIGVVSLFLVGLL